MNPRIGIRAIFSSLSKLLLKELFFLPQGAFSGPRVESQPIRIKLSPFKEKQYGYSSDGFSEVDDIKVYPLLYNNPLWGVYSKGHFMSIR